MLRVVTKHGAFGRLYWTVIGGCTVILWAYCMARVESVVRGARVYVLWPNGDTRARFEGGRQL